MKLLVKVLVAIQINLRADRGPMLLSKDFQITNLNTYFRNHSTNIAAVDLGKVIAIWDIAYVLQALFYVSPPFLQPGYFATTR